MAATLSLAWASAGRGSAASGGSGDGGAQGGAAGRVMGAPGSGDGGESSCKTRSSGSGRASRRRGSALRSGAAASVQPDRRQKRSVSAIGRAGRTPRIVGQPAWGGRPRCTAGCPAHRAGSRSAPPGAAPMTPTALSALSPLDGRYAAKLAALRPLLSEFGLMHRRVQVEVEWFIALSDAGFAEFKPLSEAARGLLRGLVRALLARPTRRPSRTSRRPPTTTSRRSSTGSRRASRATPSCRRRASSCTSPAPAKTSTTPATR